MNQEIIKVIVPIITFILGTVISLFNIKSQKKLSNRCYPSIEEAHLPIALSEVDIAPGTKMYLTGDYARIHDSATTNKSNDITYLKITNLGPGNMMNCNVNVVISTTDLKEEWHLKIHVPLIRKDEMILIPTVKMSMLNKRVITNRVLIDYLTQSNEKMRYTLKIQSVNDDSTSIKEILQVYVFKWFRKKIYSYQGKNSLFIYINYKKNK